MVSLIFGARNNKTYEKTNIYLKYASTLPFQTSEMNYFCGMIDQRKALSLISSRDYCQRFSTSQISDKSRVGFEPAQNLITDLFE